MNQSEYWVLAPRADLAARCQEKVEAYYRFCEESGRTEQIRELYTAMIGGSSTSDGAVSWKIIAGGEQGEVLSSRENHIANIAVNLLNLTTSERPAVTCGAANTDKKSLAQTLLGDGLVEFHLTEKQLEDILLRAAKSAIGQHEGFVEWGWDAQAGEEHAPEIQEEELGPSGMAVEPEQMPQVIKAGEPRFTFLGPLDVVRDPHADSFDELNWLLTRRWVSKWDMAARYPELASRIVGLSTKSDPKQHVRGNNRGDETDLIPLWTLYHRKTPAVPEGLLFLFLDDEIDLFHGPLPYKRMPVKAIVCEWVEGTPFGQSPLLHLLGPQMAIDKLDSAMVTNSIGRGIGNMWTNSASNADVQPLGPSMNLIKMEPGAVIQPVEWPHMPPEIPQLKRDKIAAMETLSGINSVVRGNPSEAVGADSSGAKLALIEAQAIKSNSGLERSWTGLVRDVALYGIIHLYRDFGGNVPRLARIAGKNNTYLVKEFTSDDLSDIERVKVDVGNPVLRTVAGKMAIADKAVELGVIKPGELQKYILLLKEGTADPLFEAEQQLQMRIRGENERLMEGGEHNAIISDPHWREIPEHLSMLDNPAIREMSPENEAIKAAVLAAVQQHIDLLLAMPAWMVLMRGGPEALAIYQQVQMSMAPPMLPPPGDSTSMTPPPGPAVQSGTPPPDSGATSVMNPNSSKPQQPGMPSLPQAPDVGAMPGGLQ